MAQAPLWGLGGVVAREQPGWDCRRVDLDPAAAVTEQAAALVDELMTTDDEDQIAYRQTRRHAARLVRGAERPADRLAIPATPFRLQLGAYGQLDRWQAAPWTRRPPGEGEVEIAVRAVGLNFRDVLRALGMLAEYEREHLGIASAAEAPFGFECAGEVVAVGAGVEGFKIGDAVLGLANGSLSSHVTVPAEAVIAVPPGWSFDAAATVPVAYLTAVYGLERLAGLRRGERVLIHAAAGGVGQAAVRVAQAAGAEIFATAHPSKWDFLKAQGIRARDEFADDGVCEGGAGGDRRRRGSTWCSTASAASSSRRVSRRWARAGGSSSWASWASGRPSRWPPRGRTFPIGPSTWAPNSAGSRGCWPCCGTTCGRGCTRANCRRLRTAVLRLLRRWRRSAISNRPGKWARSCCGTRLRRRRRRSCAARGVIWSPAVWAGWD